MEPIDASLANSSAFNVDPFDDDATNIIFGNADDLGGATQSPTSTDVATASTASGGGASQAASNLGSSGAGSSSAGSPGGFSVTTLALIAGVAFLALHFLKK